MPSWIQEKDGLEWYDEAYTTKQTNQSAVQLAKKAEAGKLRRFKQRGGGYWYARPDVEALREAFLKRSKAAKGRKPTDQQIEARHTNQWQRDMAKSKKAVLEQNGSLGGGYPSAAGRHAERVMLGEMQAAEERKKADKE